MPALPVSSGHAPRSPRRNETLLRTQINMDLYHTPARALDKLVTHSLHPSPEFTAAVRGALGSLDTALRERGAPGSQRPRVIRIAKVRRWGTPRQSPAWSSEGCSPDVVFTSHSVGKLRHQEAK